MAINNVDEFDDLISAGQKKQDNMSTSQDVKTSPSVDIDTSREPHIKTSSEMDVNTAADKDSNTSRDKDVMVSSEPYMGTSTDVDNHTSTAEDVQSSSELHRSTVRKRGKRSRRGDVTKSRLVDPGGDFERKPYNITIRCEYFKLLRIMAAEQSTEVFLLLDQAIGAFIRKEIKNK